MIRITENNIQLLCDECLIILEENIDIKNIDKKDKNCICVECKNKLNGREGVTV